MRISSNKVTDILAFFHSELNGKYEKEEIDRFAEFCFEDFNGFSKVEVMLEPGRTVSESDLLKYNFAVKDLKRGRPIQYILGHADFFGMKFLVNENVLIPRPETEELVKLVIDETKKMAGSFSILDIGTGSGCIAIALKKHLPKCHVYALDISESALEVAKQNADTLEAEVHFLKGSVLDEGCVEHLPSVSVIVSNPPYIRYSEKETMHINVTEYEPHQALFVNDDDALIFYRAIASAGRKKLKPGGKIFAEINESLGIDTALLFQKEGYTDVRLVKDMQGKDRIVICTLGQ